MPNIKPDRTSGSIRFASLGDIAPETVIAHMSDARMSVHMPLLDGPWGQDDYHRFMAAKDAYWQRDGLGHWAILVDESYVGWGGFQKEGDDWDFGLVLRPDCFGLGLAITRKVLNVACNDPRIEYVTFLLPPTRKHLRGLLRLGACFVGKVSHDGEVFLKYRLDTPLPIVR